MKRIGFFRMFKILTPVATVVAGLLAAQPAQAQLPPTQLWLRADAGVETSGGKVTTWKDQSGNNRNATPATGADAPSLVASALNGKPVIRFDGNDDGLSLGNISTAFPSAATLFIVATIRDDNYNLFTTDEGCCDAHSTNYTATFWRFSYADPPAAYPGMFRPNNSRGYGYLKGLIPASGSHLFVVESSSSNWEMWMNGTSGGMHDKGPAYFAGDEYRIGMPDETPPTPGEGIGMKYLNGDIPEIILFNRTLTATERNQVGYYLSNKYGLSTTYQQPPPSPVKPWAQSASLASPLQVQYVSGELRLAGVSAGRLRLFNLQGREEGAWPVDALGVARPAGQLGSGVWLASYEGADGSVGMAAVANIQGGK